MRSGHRRPGILLYLLLNIIVSAATTLGVLAVWDRVMRSEMPPAEALGFKPAATATPDPSGAVLQPQEVTPTASGPLIEIKSVVAAGDLAQEYVLLRRLGEGDLRLSGWVLQDENGNAYVFPSSPALILFKDGAVQIATRAGEDTPTEIFWNLTKAVWSSGEQVTLLDQNGVVQAVYRVP